MEEREALVLRGKLVGVVDTVVARVTKSSLVRRAEHRSLIFVTHVALDLHLFIFFLPFSSIQFNRYRGHFSSTKLNFYIKKEEYLEREREREKERK